MMGVACLMQVCRRARLLFGSGSSFKVLRRTEMLEVQPAYILPFV
jgi:hypothetical protein